MLCVTAGAVANPSVVRRKRQRRIMPRTSTPIAKNAYEFFAMVYYYK
jgi:hypothetical protein